MFRPAHHLAGVPRVAPYSSQRHPSSFVVAAYIQVRLTPQDFGRPRKRDFAGLNLHLGIFDQPEKNESPRLFTPNSLPSPKRFVQAGELITPNLH